jgi:branched-subunit amino acid transport protein AzlD
MSYDFDIVHMQLLVNIIKYRRRYLIYLGNSMCVIIPSCCRIHSTPHGLGYINIGPCHFILFYCCSYTGISKYHKVSPSLFDISRQLDVHYNPLTVLYTLHVTRISPYKHRTLSCHLILLLFKYCISNHHNISPTLFDISMQFDVSYNPLLVLYTLHVTRISPYKHWTLSCHMILLLFIYCYK